MFDQIYPFLLILLEMTFIFVGLGILHSQRRSIGVASFYLSLGLLLLFSQLIGAVGFEATIFGSLDFPIGPTVLVLPYLAAMLMVYVTDGTLAAQRLIIGSVVVFGFFLYLGEITRLQCNWQGFAIASNISAEALDSLLLQSRRSLVAMELALLIDLLLLPILFTRLRTAGCRLWFCVLGSLVLTQITDLLLYWVVMLWNTPDAGLQLAGTFLSRLIGAVWLSILLTIYLERIERELAGGNQRPLDILFAFLGSYGRTRALEQNLREWEGRYQLLMENASELILLLSPEGRILDANPAAARVLNPHRPPGELLGQPLFPRLSRADGKPFHPRFEPPSGGAEAEGPETTLLTLDAASEKSRQLSFSISTMETHGQRLLTFIGRDVTRELALAEEKKHLSEELAHSQRLEALGQLAGGVAHDFNNHLHAILGHLDMIDFACEVEDPDLQRHLDKIGRIAEQCGKLTSQLLGYARKGKYLVVELDLRQVLETSHDLLLPGSRKNVQLTLRLPPTPLPIRGDLVQLQQVFLNLMLNAIDATAGRPGAELTVAAGPATECPLELLDPSRPTLKIPREDYCYALVRDNGSGMEPAVLQRIFEPFFTTKPVGQGTGMGLSMVYGTVLHHHGWLQVESVPEAGSSFWIFLPYAGREPAAS